MGDQLSVCLAPQHKGLPLFHQSLSHWIVEAIKLVYVEKGLDTPGGLKAHSTRGMSTSWALFRGMTLEDFCAAVSWSTTHIFGRYYILDITVPSLGQVVLGVKTS